MASAQDIQLLLRFLSQDAKMPLAQAMGKIKDLQSAHLVTPTEIAKAEIDSLTKILGDDKLARQVLNAAKRVSKKRSSTDDYTPSVPKPPVKKAKSSISETLDPATFEASLALPEAELDEEKLKETVLFTNRAPLVLAFAATVLKYTMPEQPLSSRLSLAQAVCSANSQSKAKYIGLHKGRTAEEEGWGEGQPLITVMNRKIQVMKRWGYTWKEEEDDPPSPATISGDTQATIYAEPSRMHGNEFDTQATMHEETLPEEPALWGVDLEALKKSNGPVTVGALRTNELPIYRPESARAYLLKSFERKRNSTEQQNSGKKKSAAAEKEQNLGMLIGSIDLLCQSWAHILGKDDLDRRAWGWYCSVRPEVKAGMAGWGGKGNVALADILELRRPTG